jgi:hypothetical protein
MTSCRTTILRIIKPGNINPGIVSPEITTRGALLGLMTEEGTMSPEIMKNEGTTAGGK